MKQNPSSAADDPLGCLFDLFCYSLLICAGFCAWIWFRAGEEELPAVKADMLDSNDVRTLAAIFFCLSLLGIFALKFWGMRIYKKMKDE